MLHFSLLFFKSRHFSAISEAFLSEYRCPAFKGCIICVTGVESTQRQDVRQRVPQSGKFDDDEVSLVCVYTVLCASSTAQKSMGLQILIGSVQLHCYLYFIKSY